MANAPIPQNEVTLAAGMRYWTYPNLLLGKQTLPIDLPPFRKQIQTILEESQTMLPSHRLLEPYRLGTLQYHQACSLSPRQLIPKVPASMI